LEGLCRERGGTDKGRKMEKGELKKGGEWGKENEQGKIEG